MIENLVIILYLLFDNFMITQWKSYHKFIVKVFLGILIQNLLYFITKMFDNFIISYHKLILKFFFTIKIENMLYKIEQ